MIIIPLGTRCSGSGLLDKMKIRRQSFPFDWIDTSTRNLSKFIELEPQNCSAFIDSYIDQVKDKRHPDGTWFPHDFNPEEGQTVENTKEKYTRRLVRLIEALKSDEDKLFLTVNSHVNARGNLADYMRLVNKIRECSTGNLTFITINLTASNALLVIGDMHIYNFHLPLPVKLTVEGTEFWVWEQQIWETLAGHETLGKYFKVIEN